MDKRPNVIFVLADQWRGQSIGYRGDPNVATPRLDALAAESVDFENAVAGSPVCCPSRASMITGQFPLTHGVYINDVELVPQGPTLAESFRDAGYRTGYIGKWHLYGSPDGFYGRRRLPVPRDKQFGFDYWKGTECTHDYNNSIYYVDDDPAVQVWEGYDAQSQTDDACAFVSASDPDQPFLLMLAYGPPHFPLHTAPETYRERYADAAIQLPPNVPDELAADSVAALRGYYAHMAALDDCIGQLLDHLERSGAAEDTIVVFTSDHGDMMGSQGIQHDVKTCPWDESIRVPFLLRYPAALGSEGRVDPSVINSADIMPTLLGLCGLDVPETCEGRDVFAEGPLESAFLSMPVPILWGRTYGIGPYRGVRTARHTYVRSLDGDWLLYDNQADPHQLANLVDDPTHAPVRQELSALLDEWLDRLGDEFLPAEHYVERDGLGHYDEVLTPVGSSTGPGGSWRSTMVPTAPAES